MMLATRSTIATIEDEPNRIARRTVLANGHTFDPVLRCHCGQKWASHQNHSRPCENPRGSRQTRRDLILDRWERGEGAVAIGRRYRLSTEKIEAIIAEADRQ